MKLITFELDEKLGYARTRGADELSQVLMSCGYRQARSAFFFDAEILAQRKQNQSDALLQCATHKVCASQLDQVPSAKIAHCHPFEVCAGYAQRDFDERFQVKGSDLSGGNRLAAEVVADSGHWWWKARNHSGRDHNHQGAIAFAVTAGYTGNSGQQKIGGFGSRDKRTTWRLKFWRVLVVDDYFKFLNRSH